MTSPITRMGTSVGMAGGSLAERHDMHQHSAARARRRPVLICCTRRWSAALTTRSAAPMIPSPP
jgi:hypothetical protein